MRTFHRLKKEIGIKVLNKFGWKCSECDTKNNLCVHHIIRKKTGSKDYNDENNLLVLCRSCHMAYHRKAGHIQTEWNGHVNIWGRRGKGNPPIICCITECDKMQHGRELCKKHYEYFRRRGWNVDMQSVFPASPLLY